MSRALVVLAMWLVALAGMSVGQCAAEDSPPEPSGYRMQDYRGPTPATLAGARVVTTAEAEELWKTGAVFVDVLPARRASGQSAAGNDLARTGRG